jgi:hypothetical protein
MNEDSLLRRLRAARPAAAVTAEPAEPGDHEALFARIVAGPGDPRLARAVPVRRSRPWTGLRPRLLAGSTLGLAAAGAAVVLALSGSAAPPAFAITRSSDGSVLVKISRLESLPDANHRLTAMGIHEQVTLYMAAGVAVVKGPVECRPAPGARLSGPPLRVLVGRDGTDGAGPGQTAGVIGVDAYHLDHCMITGGSGSGNRPNGDSKAEPAGGRA